MLTRVLAFVAASLLGAASVSLLGYPSTGWAHGASNEAGQQRSALIARLDTAIEAEMRDNHIPGVGLVVVQNGATIYKRGYGVANIETGAPVDPETTIFRIGSTSKALTLLTLTRLIDQGRISRQHDVAQYFAEISNPRGLERPVTIENLLTHTTGFDQPGFGRQLGGFEYSIAERQAARPSLYEFLKQGQLRRIEEPGSMFRYDTYAPTVAGVVLEKITGLAFDEAMHQEMFEPLGMTRTSVEVRPQYERDLAKGHGFVGGQYVTTPYEIYITTPASSIDATVADMGRLLEALTGDGANASGRLLSPAMRERILEPQYRPRPGFAGMSHGLWESLSEGRGEAGIPIRTLGHGGDMWGFNGSMTLIPELDLAFYVVANRNGEGGGPGVKIGGPVMRAILQTYAPDRVPTPIERRPKSANPDLSEYTGEYVWNVYCHTCTDDEFELGAWRRGEPIKVERDSGALNVDGRLFHPMGDDVFLDDAGYDQIFFRRNTRGKIISYSFQEDPTSYEKL